MTGTKLGVILPQFSGVGADIADGARRAEAAGLDSIWVFDHLLPLGGPKDKPVAEAWTTVAYSAAVTERVKVGTLVTRSSLRPPAVLAKMAATVGALAPGRLIVGIGSGDHKSRGENDAFGLPYWSGRERYAQLASTVEVLKSYLEAPEVTVEDDFVSLSSLPANPSSEPRPAVWVGGLSDEIMELAGKMGDGYNAWGITPERFATAAEKVRAAAAGRPVELTWAGEVTLGFDDADARRRARSARRRIVGGPERVADALAGYVRAGASHLVVSLPTPTEPGLYELLGESVLPALRALP